jgi:hypothetical protein
MFMSIPLKTFIIYSSADRKLREALELHIKPLIDNKLIQLWSDREILPGEAWDLTIKNQLLEAEIFLILISADFFNSDYIRGTEFAAALQKLEQGESVIIPIIIRDCDWEIYPEIQSLQVVPPKGIPVNDLEHWKTEDKAWAIVVREVRRRVESIIIEEEQGNLQKQILNTEKRKQVIEQKPKRARVLEERVCKRCFGSGQVQVKPGLLFGRYDECPECNGIGSWCIEVDL